ncbi:hypothetical protein MTO96_024800 [Rhipicephalus appendiculatus]
MHVVQEPISSGERLAMTLRYLCSGNAIIDIAKDFRVGLETAREAIHLTLQVLWDDLTPQYMKWLFPDAQLFNFFMQLPSLLWPVPVKPPNEHMWRNIADGFWKRWQFPNCLGSVDGKHVQIVAPANSGSLYYNYKGTFSIVLMAVADSGYLFRLIDVGAPGRISDGGVFKRSPIGRRLDAGQLQVPSYSQLPGSNKALPYAFIGDEAFQLRNDFMRPFPGSREDPSERIFNYRLSRARRCVENAFGILQARFRIFRGPINLSPENAKRAVKAACVLHNFLCMESSGRYSYSPVGFADHEDVCGNVIHGAWRESLGTKSATFGLRPTRARRGARSALHVRKQYAEYFANEGNVPWQWKLLDIAEPNCEDEVQE